MDNPYSPFTQFKEWYAFDVQHGYNTCCWLDRYCKTSLMFEEETMLNDINNAMNEFLAFNPFGIHIKVYDYEAETLIPVANAAYKEMFNAS